MYCRRLCLVVLYLLYATASNFNEEGRAIATNGHFKIFLGRPHELVSGNRLASSFSAIVQTEGQRQASENSFLSICGHCPVLRTAVLTWLRCSLVYVRKFTFPLILVTDPFFITVPGRLLLGLRILSTLFEVSKALCPSWLAYYSLFGRRPDYQQYLLPN